MVDRQSGLMVGPCGVAVDGRRYRDGIAEEDRGPLQRKRIRFMFNFEKLDTWKEAIAFAELVYSLTRKLPDDERFGLCTQMRRAAVSVSSNIAEGSARRSRSDFARFVEIATGSLFEGNYSGGKPQMDVNRRESID
jgi:hypothetical protein